MRLAAFALLLAVVPLAAADPLALQPTGDATADTLAVSGTGDARCTSQTCVAASGTGSAYAPGRVGVAAAPLGNAEGGGACAQPVPYCGGVGLSLTGDAAGTFALTPLGDAKGGVSVTLIGDSTRDYRCIGYYIGGLCPAGVQVTALGNAWGGTAGISGTGYATGFVAVSGTGSAQGTVFSLSGCSLAGACL